MENENSEDKSMSIAMREHIASMIKDVQHELMLTATLREKTHRERNQETTVIVRKLQQIKRLILSNEDVTDIPF